MWIGGSLARGSADQWSDVDLRVAVVAAARSAWYDIDGQVWGGESTVGQTTFFAGGGITHQLVTADGYILELTVVMSDEIRVDEPIVVLGAKDEELEQLLLGAGGATQAPASAVPSEGPDRPELSGEMARELLVDAWIVNLKQVKALARGRVMVLQLGFHLTHATLLRLWQVALTGRDPGHPGRISLYAQGVMAEELGAKGERLLQHLGAARQAPEDMQRLVHDDLQALSEVGHLMSARYGFPYPQELEAAVLKQARAVG